MSIRHLTALLTAFFAFPAGALETVQFPSADGLQVTADVYPPETTPRTALLLFHMAGSSRGEYRDIAPRLARLGYVAVAIDLRSGGSFAGVVNETAAAAGADPGYEATIPDIEAALGWARDNLGVERIGVVGSSYSASLVLVLAGRDPKFTDAAMAFSPGEYFADRRFVRDAATGVTVPVFITGAKKETGNWQPIFKAIPGPGKVGFKPPVAGRHGASALAADKSGAYWKALDAFLARYLPAR